MSFVVFVEATNPTQHGHSVDSGFSLGLDWIRLDWILSRRIGLDWMFPSIGKQEEASARCDGM